MYGVRQFSRTLCGPGGRTKGGVDAPPYKLSLRRGGLAVVFNMCLGCFPSMVHCVFKQPGVMASLRVHITTTSG